METARQRNLNEFGKHAELWVCEQLRNLGLTVEHIGTSHEYDLLIEGSVRGEVKCATKSKARGNRSNRWQFSFGRHNGINDEEIVFLVCYDGDIDNPVGTFVIPGSAVDAELKKIDITSRLDRYSGKWAKYLSRWDIVGDVIRTGRVRKPVLFREKVEEEILF